MFQDNHVIGRGAVFTHVVKKDFSYIVGNSYIAGKTHTKTKQNKTKQNLNQKELTEKKQNRKTKQNEAQIKTKTKA